MPEARNGASTALAISVAKLEVTSEDHERRITVLEDLAWKVVFAALAGALAGGGLMELIGRVAAGG